jgi:hypothetical protein
MVALAFEVRIWWDARAYFIGALLGTFRWRPQYKRPAGALGKNFSRYGFGPPGRAA